MRKIVTATLLCASLSLGLAGQALAVDNNKAYNVVLDGKKLNIQAKEVESTLFVPLRSIGESLNYKIEWSGKDQIVTLSKSNQKIVIDLKDYKIVVGSHESFLTSSPEIVNGRILIPSDILADNFHLKVEIDNGELLLNRVEENKISIVNQREVFTSKTIDQTIQYPEIQGLSNQDVQNKLNAIFKNMATAAKEEGLKNVQEYSVPDGNMMETYFNYSVKLNRNGLLSIVFYNYQYTGGAHGITVQSSGTYDLSTGQEYKMSDLFKKQVDYVKLVSGEVKKQMKEKSLTEAALVPFSTIRSDQDYYLNNNAMVVYFQQYEYFAYAMGIPEFAMDRNVLKDSLNTQFVGN